MSSHAPLPQQASFLDAPDPAISTPVPVTKNDDELAAEINAALAAGEPASVLDALGSTAKAHGMSQASTTCCPSLLNRFYRPSINGVGGDLSLIGAYADCASIAKTQPHGEMP